MRLGDYLLHLLACAEDELEAAGRTVPDEVFIAPGLPAFDSNCGQLWARVIRGYPSQIFPQKFLDIRPCGVPLAMQVGLGITRCQSGVHRLDEGGYPTPDEKTTDALGIICDQGALFRALACCGASPGEEELPEMVVDEWTQLEPQGAVIGGEWTAWVVADLMCDASPGSP